MAETLDFRMLLPTILIAGPTDNSCPQSKSAIDIKALFEPLMESVKNPKLFLKYIDGCSNPLLQCKSISHLDSMPYNKCLDLVELIEDQTITYNLLKYDSFRSSSVLIKFYDGLANCFIKQCSGKYILTRLSILWSYAHLAPNYSFRKSITAILNHENLSVLLIKKFMRSPSYVLLSNTYTVYGLNVENLTQRDFRSFVLLVFCEPRFQSVVPKHNGICTFLEGEAIDVHDYIYLLSVFKMDCDDDQAESTDSQFAIQVRQSMESLTVSDLADLCDQSSCNADILQHNLDIIYNRQAESPNHD
eukprot:NODE_125_length_18781_cov_0.243015.p5 type:complete len:303 gc:universal NODE_125_length_18781_cov_0.243015:17022-16114(-)